MLARLDVAGLDTVVTVTHAFEYFKRRSKRGEVRASRINQKRLKAFCSAVSRDPDRLLWSTFGKLAAQWQLTPFAPEATVAGSMLLAAIRMIENAANDRIRWL